MVFPVALFSSVKPYAYVGAVRPGQKYAEGSRKRVLHHIIAIVRMPDISTQNYLVKRFIKSFRKKAESFGVRFNPFSLSTCVTPKQGP